MILLAFIIKAKLLSVAHSYFCNLDPTHLSRLISPIPPSHSSQRTLNSSDCQLQGNTQNILCYLMPLGLMRSCALFTYVNRGEVLPSAAPGLIILFQANPITCICIQHLRVVCMYMTNRLGCLRMGFMSSNLSVLGNQMSPNYTSAQKTFVKSECNSTVICLSTSGNLCIQEKHTTYISLEKLKPEPGLCQNIFICTYL